MKRGFTLVELLAVITLLGMLLAFTYPKIADIKEKKEKELDSAKVTLIENAAKSYMDTNLNEYSQNIGDTHCIELDTLVNENLVPVDIKEIQEKYNYVKVKIGLNGNNSYTLVKKDDTKACGKIVGYSDACAGTRIGYPFDGGINLGEKYVYNYIVDYPYETLEECGNDCEYKPFTTRNLHVQDEPPNQITIKYTANGNRIIEKMEICTYVSGELNCFDQMKNVADYEKVKTKMIKLVGSSNCTVDDTSVRCSMPYEKYSTTSTVDLSIYKDSKTGNYNFDFSNDSYTCYLDGSGGGGCIHSTLYD